MFSFLKKKKKKPVQLFDLKGEQLQAGDRVEAKRYELGESELLEIEQHYYYRSLKTGEQVSYLKMVDAITGHQKVIKQAH